MLKIKQENGNFFSMSREEDGFKIDISKDGKLFKAKFYLKDDYLYLEDYDCKHLVLRSQDACLTATLTSGFSFRYEIVKICEARVDISIGGAEYLSELDDNDFIDGEEGAHLWMKSLAKMFRKNLD